MEGDLAGQHDGTIAVGIRHVLCVPLRVTPMSGRAIARPSVSSASSISTAASAAPCCPTPRGRRSKRSPRRRRWPSTARDSTPSRPRRRASIAISRLPPRSSARAARAGVRDGIVDLAAESIPCRTVGGDFFDYLEIGERGFGFALGDVAGKGPPAALLAAAVQSNFVAHAPVSGEPADTMARVNKALLRRAIDARFATMFYGAVTADGRLSYCNAGQEPPLVVGRKQHRVARRREDPCSDCSRSRPTSSRRCRSNRATW